MLVFKSDGSEATIEGCSVDRVIRTFDCSIYVSASGSITRELSMSILLVVEHKSIDNLTKFFNCQVA